MVASSLCLSNSTICPLPNVSSQPLLSFSHSLRPFITKSKPICASIHQQQKRDGSQFVVKSQALDFSGTFFEGGFGSDDDPTSPSGSGVSTALEDKPEPQCPPGLRQYETMAVLRPDMSEDERLGLTQKYEELLVAGGGMYVEVFNRGVIPLAYSIRKKNKAGETNTYLDGIYLLFTYFTKPESITPLETVLTADDDIIRSSSFKIKKRKYN
ncbi:Ribosomal protein S6 superfamily [Arabidopsis suecica]|uniref:Ribosomal protein S6 superfamily n=1 Tax=Arabidopsis suecica TaxID=45249 RepID=A0A8T2BMN4_ARASU|nr:Ribosomal protein S6 superfamily [Arabidopsis suecica]